jgi:hypothetical protein
MANSPPPIRKRTGPGILQTADNAQRHAQDTDQSTQSPLPRPDADQTTQPHAPQASGPKNPSRLPPVPSGHKNRSPQHWESNHPVHDDPVFKDADSPSQTQQISTLESQCEALKEAVRELSWYKHSAEISFADWDLRDAYRESESQANAVEIKQLRAELSLAHHLWTGTQDRIDESHASIHALAKTIKQHPDVDSIDHALGQVRGAYDSIEEWCKGVRPADAVNPAHVKDMHRDEQMQAARYSGMVAAAHAVGVQLKTEIGPYAPARVTDIAYNKGWHEATSYHTRVMLDEHNPDLQTCTPQMHEHHAKQADMYGEMWQNERSFGHDTSKMKKKAYLSFVGHPREGFKNMSEETRRGYFGEVYRSVNRDREYSGFFADGAYPIAKESFSTSEDQTTWEEGNRLAGQAGASSSRPVPAAEAPVPSQSSQPAQSPRPVTAGVTPVSAKSSRPVQSSAQPSPQTPDDSTQTSATLQAALSDRLASIRKKIEGAIQDVAEWREEHKASLEQQPDQRRGSRPHQGKAITAPDVVEAAEEQ